MPHIPWTNFITDNNHGAWVTAVAAILLTWMLLFLLMRAAIRVRFNGPWGHDDYTVTAGSVSLSKPVIFHPRSLSDLLAV